jgi:hypothetical protein
MLEPILIATFVKVRPVIARAHPVSLPTLVGHFLRPRMATQSHLITNRR